jgi:hypothetical protein
VEKIWKLPRKVKIAEREGERERNVRCIIVILGCRLPTHILKLLQEFNSIGLRDVSRPEFSFFFV